MTKPKPRPGVRTRKLDERYALSFQPAAPDHGRPELALVDHRPGGRRYAILATGEEALHLWERDGFPKALLNAGKRALERGEIDVQA